MKKFSLLSILIILFLSSCQTLGGMKHSISNKAESMANNIKDEADKIKMELSKSAREETKKQLINVNAKMMRIRCSQPIARAFNSINYENKNMWDKFVEDGLQVDSKAIIHHAFQEHTHALLYYMIGHGIDAKESDRNGNNMVGAHLHASDSISKLLYQKLMDNGYKINSRNKRGYTLLEEHFLYNDSGYNEVEEVEAVKFHLSHGEEIQRNWIDIFCRQHYLNYASLRLIAEKYREKFQDISPRNCMEALFLGDEAYVKKNFRAEQWTDQEQEQLIFYEAALGNKETLIEMLQYFNTPLDIQDKRLHYLVMAAAAGGNEDTFQYLKEVSPYTSPTSDVKKTLENNGESLMTCALAGGVEEIIDAACEDPEVFPGEGIYGEHSVLNFTGWDIASFGDINLVKRLIRVKAWENDTLSRILSYVGSERDIEFFSELWEMEEVKALRSDQECLIDLLGAGIKAEMSKIILMSLDPEMRQKMLPGLRATFNTRESNCIVDLVPYIEVYHDCGIDFHQDSTAIVRAAAFGETEAVRKLIEYGADVSGLSSEPGGVFTALMETAHLGDAVITGLLLENGADPNIKNPSNETALMHALASPVGSPECVKLMLDYGADATVITPDGDSCLDLAKRWGNKEVIAMVEEALK